MLKTNSTPCPDGILIPAPRPQPEWQGSDSIVEVIFRGVTEDIFVAFQRSRPGMFRREFENFAIHVRQGLGSGVGDAYRALNLTRRINAHTESALHANSALLFERLEVWFEKTRKRLFE